MATTSSTSEHLSRYYLKDITETRPYWSLCTTIVADNIDFQCSTHRPQPCDNKENVHRPDSSMCKSLVTYWCADCAYIFNLQPVTLSKWNSMKHIICSSCNCELLIANNHIINATNRTRYKSAIKYLNDTGSLVLTFDDISLGRRHLNRE